MAELLDNASYRFSIDLILSRADLRVQKTALLNFCITPDAKNRSA
ncbi:MAG: hypothetical protein AB7S75_02705 [Desulfococcaceae bacterium]